jgi:selenocysteine-specific elongation factor
MAIFAYPSCRQPYYRTRIAAGGDLAELVLDTPLWLADNDRLVLRDISARVTLAGARVVTLNPPRRGKRKPEYLQWLAALAAAADDAQALDIHLQRDAVRLDDFAWARQLSDEGLNVLINRPDYLQAGNSLLSAPLAARWQTKLLDALARYHDQHRDEPGPGRERLRRIALPMEDEALVLLLIEQMRASGTIDSHHGWLHLPEHKAGFTEEQQASGCGLPTCLPMSPGGYATWRKRRALKRR